MDNFVFCEAKDDQDSCDGGNEDDAYDEFMARFKKVPIEIVGHPLEGGPVVLWEAAEEME